MEDEIDFGKYKGHTIKEIYKFVPDYLDWCLINVEKFYIDLSELKTLPTPTPMRLGCFTLNGMEAWVSNMSPNKNYIKEAYKFIGLGNIIEESKFNFSEKAKAAATKKAEKLNQLNDEIYEDQHPSNNPDYYDTSYEKYGGYNDFDDDTIDTAFEGDPSATWNVD